jgi:hypothetical protein
MTAATAIEMPELLTHANTTVATGNVLSIPKLAMADVVAPLATMKCKGSSKLDMMGTGKVEIFLFS